PDLPPLPPFPTRRSSDLPYPPCPDVLLLQGEEIPDDAVACIEHAGPEGAELAVVRPTTEGDPYVMFYRVGHGIQGLEIWEDATRSEEHTSELQSRGHLVC